MRFSVYLLFLIVYAVYGFKYIKVHYFQFGASLCLQFEMKLLDKNEDKVFELDLKGNSTFISTITIHNYNGTQYASGVYDFGYKKNVSYILTKKEVTFQINEIEGINVKKTLEDFYFYYLEEHIYFYDTLSLTYKYDDIRLSLLHSLYNNRMINHLKFGIVNNNFKEGFVYLGGFPKKMTSKLHKASCEVNKNSKIWGCDLKKVIIGDMVYHNKYLSYFQTTNIYLKVPINFYSFLMTHIFKEKNRKVKTNINPYIKEFKYDCEEMNNIPLFGFVMGSYVIELNISHLLNQSERICILELDKNKLNEDEWEFGIHFLSLYHTEFDHETNSIIFYSKDKFKKIINTKVNIICILYFICVIPMLIISIFLIYLKFEV